MFRNTIVIQTIADLHIDEFGSRSLHKNNISHIDASLSRQPLVKGERLIRYEVNAVMLHYSPELCNAPCLSVTECLNSFRTESFRNAVFIKG